MIIVRVIVPVLVISMAVVFAIAPLGLPDWAGIMAPVLPAFLACVFIMRGRGVALSPVLFGGGLVVDIASDGPLGFWALIYLFATLIAYQLPASLVQSRVGRACGLVLIVFAVAVAEAGLASLYQLKWVNWHSVLGGTFGAGLVAVVVDLAWRSRVAQSGHVVTSRGGAATQRGT